MHIRLDQIAHVFRSQDERNTISHAKYLATENGYPVNDRVDLSLDELNVAIGGAEKLVAAQPGEQSLKDDLRDLTELRNKMQGLPQDRPQSQWNPLGWFVDVFQSDGRQPRRDPFDVD